MIRNFVVDMNHNDEVTSFAEAGQAGIIGIIHKASIGASGQDPRYAERKAAAYQAGLLWGAYHWGTAADIDAQVNNFLSVINPAGPAGGLDGVLVALDFERTYLEGNSGDTMSLDQARQFVSKLDQILGRQVVIYGGDLIKSGLGDTVDPFWGPIACGSPSIASRRRGGSQAGQDPGCGNTPATGPAPAFRATARVASIATPSWATCRLRSARGRRSRPRVRRD